MIFSWAREARRKHEAWGGAKRNPRDRWSVNGKPTKWAIAFHHSKSQRLPYRTLRALGLITFRYPGVPLRSAPGFMLPPASRVLKKMRHDLFRTYLNLYFDPASDRIDLSGGIQDWLSKHGDIENNFLFSTGPGCGR